jgi:hypothetical protein
MPFRVKLISSTALVPVASTGMQVSSTSALDRESPTANLSAFLSGCGPRGASLRDVHAIFANLPASVRKTTVHKLAEAS